MVQRAGTHLREMQFMLRRLAGRVCPAAAIECARCDARQAAPKRSYRPGPNAVPRWSGPWEALMKIVLWIIGIIFLIGLAVVLGLGKLIF